ncbi:hypothetical protein [Erysipelothrix larvae]|nr:hypothetical protein [Erysipelothrix larvae]
MKQLNANLTALNQAMTNSVALKLKKRLSQLVSNPRLIDDFNICVDLMVDEGCTVLHLFELFHEFGHYCKCIERNGTVTLIQVSQFIFLFKDDAITLNITTQQSQSFILCTLPFDDHLLENLRAVCYEGMVFSQACILYCFPSLKAWVFNVVNAPKWPFYRKGSDAYLYHKGLKTLKDAHHFNTNAHRETLKIRGMDGL